jgi:16S rRNA (cytosine1407-C5)-methyltransferase
VNIGVMKNKGELLSKIFDNHFDKILVDAPCSALGITQKKGEVSNWWNEKKAKGIAEIQYKLLTSAMKMCRIGGEIVYSTCTVTLEENELVLDKILKKYPVELIDVELPLKSHEGITRIFDEDLNPQILKARRIVPWEVNSEGFFVAKLKKLGQTDSSEKFPGKDKKLELLKSSSSKMQNIISYLCSSFGIKREVFDEYKYLIKQEDIYFVNKDWECDSLDMFVRIGSKLGSIDKHRNVQLHTLAAQSLGKYAVRNIVSLENQNELETYFRGGTIKKELEPGQKIVKYKNYILGTASVSIEGLKSQFPRAFRTQEINLK